MISGKNSGFSFVEVLVVIVLMAILVAGGNWYFSQYSGRKAVDQAISIIASQIEIARSHAKTNRIPAGQVQKINYVSVLLDDNGLTLVSDIGTTYSRVDINQQQVDITSLANCDLCFGAGVVSLVDESNQPRTFDYVVEVRVELVSDPEVYKQIAIDSSGLIREVAE